MTSAWSRSGSRTALIVVTVAGLAEDAYVHVHLATSYDAVRSAVLTEGDLFRLEAALAVLAAVALLALPRASTAFAAFLVASGGVGAVLLYTYVRVGAVGPLPAMYEPFWYPDKARSLWAEAAAALAALALVASHAYGRRGGSRSTRGDRTAEEVR